MVIKVTSYYDEKRSSIDEMDDVHMMMCVRVIGYGCLLRVCFLHSSDKGLWIGD